MRVLYVLVAGGREDLAARMWGPLGRYFRAARAAAQASGRYSKRRRHYRSSSGGNNNNRQLEADSNGPNKLDIRWADDALGALDALDALDQSADGSAFEPIDHRDILLALLERKPARPRLIYGRVAWAG